MISTSIGWESIWLATVITALRLRKSGAAPADGETALQVEIDQQNILAFTGKLDPKTGTGACLTRSAFLVDDCCDCRRHLVLPPYVLHRRISIVAEAWADVLIPCWTSMGSDETRRYGRYREDDGICTNGIPQTFRLRHCHTGSRGFHAWQLQKRGYLHIGAWDIPPLREIEKPRCIVVIHRGYLTFSCVCLGAGQGLSTAVFCMNLHCFE